MTLLGERELQRMAREVLSRVEADQAEVMLFGGTSALTRFANNYIHQNVNERNTNVILRVFDGKRAGTATKRASAAGKRAGTATKKRTSAAGKRSGAKRSSSGGKRRSGR